MIDKQILTDWDKKYLWHPFTQMKDWLDEEPLIIESGDGCHLIDVEGNVTSMECRRSGCWSMDTEEKR